MREIIEIIVGVGASVWFAFYNKTYYDRLEKLWYFLNIKVTLVFITTSVGSEGLKSQ